MEFGVFMFVTEYSLSAVDFGREAEELGFDSLFLPEHTHIPSSRRTPWPGGRELPREYSHSVDPFVALGAVASVTERIKLGTGVSLVVERDPIALAKEVATVDLLSGGRFQFGIGGGWNREEMENHGTDPKQRWEILRERTLAMKEIWTKDEAEFHGEHVSFDPIWSWPKPLQRPHPPIWVGGDGARTLERVVEYGDGWMPITGRGERPLADRVAELGRLAREAGRGPIPTMTFLAPADPRVIAQHQAAGAIGAVFRIPPDSPSEARSAMKECANVAWSFR